MSDSHEDWRDLNQGREPLAYLADLADLNLRVVACSIDELVAAPAGWAVRLSNGHTFDVPVPDFTPETALVTGDVLKWTNGEWREVTEVYSPSGLWSLDCVSWESPLDDYMAQFGDA